MNNDFDIPESFKKMLMDMLEEHSNESEDDAVISVLNTLAEDMLPVLFANEIIKGIDASIKEVNTKLAETNAAYKVQLKHEYVYGALIDLIVKKYGQTDDEDMDSRFVKTIPA